MEITLIAIAVVIIIVVIIISIRNRLIGLKNKVDYANGSVDAMFKQRYDLIPNLVASVKQYMQHESSLLEKLIELRSQAQKPSLTSEQKIDINTQIDQALKSFNLTVENYPNLKANEQFSRLQASLNECEGQLAAARRTYNATVMDYNNAVEMFPTSIFASSMGYKTKPMITATAVEQQNPSVKDLF
ncbi:LemA family protein [Dysgonomonas sp. 216]|uniref:LemA family protein n=1 Tax=Dysgonomonas sp. 216 TaxID=2302934 RepID=UPI0013D0BFCA|nr:LemA family protein [Dysgonomonas sp. 216]NDW18593.1 LemA family protein [Dysgonomonas sp. 216]